MPKGASFPILFIACAAVASTYTGRTATFEDDEFLIDTWETDQGLPENSATCMVQLQNDQLWFGTFNGLVRFDGTSFAVFDPSNHSDLPSPEIDNLLLEPGGRLWIATGRGVLSRPDGPGPGAGANSPVTINGNIGRVRTMSQGGGVVCITTFDGRLFRADDGRVVELGSPSGQSPVGFFGHVETNGTIWAFNKAFAGRLSGTNWIAAPFAGDVTPSFEWGGEGRRGEAVLLYGSTLAHLDAGSQLRKTTLERPLHHVWSLTEDSDGVVWIAGFRSGLDLVSATGAIRHYGVTNGLTSDSLRFVFEDKEKSRWVGTSGGGLIRFKRKRFAMFGAGEGLTERNVKAIIEEAPGKMLVGTFGGGLERLENGRFSKVDANVGDDLETYVQCLAVDHRLRTWVGLWKDGLRVNSGGEWKTALPGITVNAVFEDSQGRIWVGNNDEVIRLDEATFQRSPKAGLLAPVDVRYFAEDPVNRTLWTAGKEGIHRLVGDSWEQVFDAKSKPIRDALCLHFESDGTLWVGLRGGGLLRYRTNGWASIPYSEWLPARNIGCILEDRQGFHWLATENGAIRFGPEDLDNLAEGRQTDWMRTVFNASDGVATMAYASGFQSTGCRDSQGRLWFATLKGVLRIDPAGLAVNPVPPKIQMTKLRYEDAKGMQHETPLPAKGPLAIPAGVREVAIYYTAATYSAPEKVGFKYQLSGIHDQWVDHGNRRNVYFFPPHPGTYTFKVKASGPDGAWSSDYTGLTFTVAPFFWQTPWFMGLSIGFLASGVGIAGWQASKRKIQDQLERLAQREALEKERGRLASVLEGTADLVGFSNLRGGEVFLNRAGRAMLGIGEGEDLSTLKLADYVTPASKELFLSTAIPTAVEEGAWRGETVLRRRDGREIPVLQVLVSHRRKDKTLDFLSTIARDITDLKRREEETRRALSETETARRVLTKSLAEQKQIEEALRISEQRFRAAMLHSPIGFAISGPDGRWLEVNPAFGRIVGYAVQELRGINSHDLTHPDDARDDVEFDRRLLAGEVEEVEREKRYRKKDGTVVWVQVNASVIWNADGSARHVVTQIQDVTDRKQAQEALQNLNARYRREEAALTALTRNYAPKPDTFNDVVREIAEVVSRTLEIDRVSIWTYNHDRSALGCIELFNRRGAVHASGAELKRVDREAFFNAADSSDVIAVQDVGRDERTKSMVSDYFGPAGAMALVAAPLHSGETASGLLMCEHCGEPRSWAPDEQTFAVAVANLLSALLSQLEQQRLAGQLRQTHKLEALGALAGGIAHDFNNMLGAIISFTELTKMDNAENPDLQENLHEVLKASRRAASMVRQILAFSRQQKVEKRRTDIAPAIGDALALLRSTLPATIEIERRFEPNLPIVRADVTQLHQVIMNLGANAAHAMKDRPGRLTVTLDRVEFSEASAKPEADMRAGVYVRLRVADTGHGMTEDTLNRIFEPFFTTKSPSEGTGLGLAVVHGAVKDHGGAIIVESKLGAGTTFTIYFPAAPAGPADPLPDAKQVPRGRSEHVLVVDDEVALCEVTRQMLTRLGYQVTPFNNPEAAWKAFEQRPDLFAVVITDLTMPGLTGLELAGRIHNLRPKTPIIVASGYIGNHTDESVRAQGVQLLLHKPLDFRALAVAIAQVLETN
jgi:PAS domain S-box-containing protein